MLSSTCQILADNRLAGLFEGEGLFVRNHIGGLDEGVFEGGGLIGSLR